MANTTRLQDFPTLWYPPILCVLVLFSSAFGQETKSIVQHTPRSAFGFARVRLQSLRDSEHYRLLPLDKLIPSKICLQQIDEEFVSEFAIFVSNGNNIKQQNVSDEDFELAAVAQLTDKAAGIEFSKLVQQYRKRVTPWKSMVPVRLKQIQVGSHQVWMAPAGTILNARRQLGKLRFLDRDGELKPNGINVGGFSRHGYIEGNTNSRGIYTFSDVNAQSLIGDKLIIEFRPDVFMTYRLEQQQCPASIVLRNPETKQESSPIHFMVQSLSDQRIEIPRKLTGTTADNRQSNLDLLENLVADEKLEVVVRFHVAGTYLGMRVEDLNINSGATEYLTVKDGKFFAAQSQTALLEMLEPTPIPQIAKFGQALRADPMSEITSNLRLDSAENTTAFKSLMDYFSLTGLVQLLGNSMKEIEFRCSTTNSDFCALQCTSKHKFPKMEQDDIRKTARSLEKELVDRLVNFATEKMVRHNLSSMGMRLMKVLPAKDLLEPDNKVIARSLASTIRKVFSKIDFVADDNCLEFKLSWPFEPPARISIQERRALVTLQDFHADQLIKHKQYIRGADIQEQALRLVPRENEWHYDNMHQLMFNISQEFDAFEHKYYWIQRGILFGIKSAKENQGDLDVLWNLACLLYMRLGLSDEAIELQKLFDEDSEIHQELGQLIDLDATKCPAGRVSCFLIARELLQYCANEASDDQETPRRLPLDTYRVNQTLINVQSQYARDLDNRGFTDDAGALWKELIQEYQRFGSIGLDYQGRAVLLREGKAFLETTTGDGKDQEFIDLKNRIDEFVSGIEQVHIEQLSETRQIRRLEFDANQLLKKHDFDSALQLQVQALKRVISMINRLPDKEQAISRAFEDLRFSTSQLADQLEKSLPKEIARMLAQLGAVEKVPPRLKWIK